jgi:hypothetical protein
MCVYAFFRFAKGFWLSPSKRRADRTALAVLASDRYASDMIAVELSDSVLALPEAERLELARRIVESVAEERRIGELVSEGVRRIEEVVTGEVRGLTEEEFRAAVG